jgi:hypothetical protein
MRLACEPLWIARSRRIAPSALGKPDASIRCHSACLGDGRWAPMCVMEVPVARTAFDQVKGRNLGCSREVAGRFGVARGACSTPEWFSVTAPLTFATRAGQGTLRGWQAAKSRRSKIAFQESRKRYPSAISGVARTGKNRWPHRHERPPETEKSAYEQLALGRMKPFACPSRSRPYSQDGQGGPRSAELRAAQSCCRTPWPPAVRSYADRLASWQDCEIVAGWRRRIFCAGGLYRTL